MPIMPSTFTEWKDTLRILYNNHQLKQEFHKAAKPIPKPTAFLPRPLTTTNPFSRLPPVANLPPLTGTWAPGTHQGQGIPMDINRTRRPLTCYNCRQQGHIARDCPHPPQQQVRQVGICCYNCNQEGHIARNCTQPQRQRFVWSAPTTTSTSTPTVPPPVNTTTNWVRQVDMEKMTPDDLFAMAHQWKELHPDSKDSRMSGF